MPIGSAVEFDASTPAAAAGSSAEMAEKIVEPVAANRAPIDAVAAQRGRLHVDRLGAPDDRLRAWPIDRKQARRAHRGGAAGGDSWNGPSTNRPAGLSPSTRAGKIGEGRFHGLEDDGSLPPETPESTVFANTARFAAGRRPSAPSRLDRAKMSSPQAGSTSMSSNCATGAPMNCSMSMPKRRRRAAERLQPAVRRSRAVTTIRLAPSPHIGSGPGRKKAKLWNT